MSTGFASNVWCTSMQRALRHTAGLAAPHVGISPNTITLIGACVTATIAATLLNMQAIGGIFGSKWVPAVLLVALILSNTFIDNLDGMVARYHKKTSAIGATLDLCADAFYAFVIISLMVSKASSRGIVLAAFMFIMTCFWSSLVLTRGANPALAASYTFTLGYAEAVGNPPVSRPWDDLFVFGGPIAALLLMYL